MRSAISFTTERYHARRPSARRIAPLELVAKGLHAGIAEAEHPDRFAAHALRRQPLADREQAPAGVDRDLHVVVVVAVLVVDRHRDGRREPSSRRCSTRSSKSVSPLSSTKSSVIALRASQQVARLSEDAKKGLKSVSTRRPGIRVAVEEALHALRPEAEHDGDLPDPAARERAQLELEHGARAVDLEQALRFAFGERQQPPALAGAEHDRLHGLPAGLDRSALLPVAPPT